MASVVAIGIMREKAVERLLNAANSIASELDLEPLALPEQTRGGAEYNHALQLQAIADHMALIDDALRGGVTIGEEDVIDYESQTVAQLKELAGNRGIEIASDARKADIIAKLEGSA